jgi:peptide/nickel transport system ATP-binding protein
MTELLRTEHLTRHFKIGGTMSRRTLHAVDDVSFGINEREIVALAGESGSGKSTIARMLARIYQPTSGEIYFEGKPLSRIRSRRDRLRYSGLVPMVFQDPFGSINPVFRVQHGVLRSLKLHRPELSAKQRLDDAARMFEVVGLNADMLQRFPYELSGGQRQRVGFAQALAMRPKLILADEPVSMLDVSIRIGLLNLMAKLRDEEGVSILYITHDIASARYVADRLIVMYAGQIAETGPIEDVLAHPRHPYTQLLLSAVPDPRAPLSVAAETDRGEPPKVIDPTPGCRFRWRCPLAIDTCAQVTPELAELPSPAGGSGGDASLGHALAGGSGGVVSPGQYRHDVACHVAQTSAEEVKAPWLGKHCHEACGDWRRIYLHAGTRGRDRPTAPRSRGAGPGGSRSEPTGRRRTGIGSDHGCPRSSRPGALDREPGRRRRRRGRDLVPAPDRRAGRPPARRNLAVGLRMRWAGNHRGGRPGQGAADRTHCP